MATMAEQEGRVMDVVFVLGAPGAGKGTQCQLLQQHTGYRHISAGDLLRQEMKNDNSDLKPIIEESLRVSPLVPGDLMAKLLLKAMRAGGHHGYIIDGFPRNFSNLEFWNHVVGSKATIGAVIHLHCPLEICMIRCLGRGPASGRQDDTEENLKKRFEHYVSKEMPVVDHFRSNGKLFEFDATRHPELVNVDIRQACFVQC